MLKTKNWSMTGSLPCENKNTFQNLRKKSIAVSAMSILIRILSVRKLNSQMTKIKLKDVLNFLKFKNQLCRYACSFKEEMSF